MKYLLIILLSGNWFFGFSQANSTIWPTIFMPGIVSTGYNERDMAISPDGKEMFYTIQSPRLSFSVIVHRIFKNNKWGDAEVAPFSGQYADWEAAFSPDGNKLFFVSNRPLTDSGKIKDFDIWYVQRRAKGWSAPVNAGNKVNSEKNEFYPSVTKDGSIYFTAERKDVLGKEDIYKSKWMNDKFEEPVNIGPAVNSALDEFNAFVDPDERYIIFSAEGGEGDLGRGDLYISYRKTDNNWTKPKNLGPSINSSRLDYCPFVYKNTLYFTSERVVTVYKAGRKLSYQQARSKLNQWGNGFGDIYYIPVSDIVK